MKIIIAGHEYSMATVGKLTLWDVIEMEKQTGLTLDDFSARMQEMGDVAAKGGDDVKPDYFAVGVLIWLTRRKAGESLTLEQALDFPLDELEMVEEPGDVEASPDPQVA